ncbi:MAG: serine/threonine protein kinase [Planctomycetaceae bacterium]|nr:serine/threonine protein kinase [Planctomycetaceae bacterium]
MSGNPSGDKKTVTLGDFELRKKLGQGGMGTVYLGHQISLDRDCAVKVLSKELASKSAFVDRFVREARSMAKIDHPNVVSCYAVGTDKGHHYVAMELMDGKSMQDWLDHQGKLSVADAVLVTMVAAEALHYAHELNIVHRDIKPDNLLVTRKGVVKVSDMGLAKAIDDEDMSLTQSGTGLGTPHYMPPEQARNAKHVDRRCDIYALGCTLYHFVTGALPFAGESVVELITNKEKGKFKPAHQLNSEVPEKLSLMIDKAMAKDPKHRYQTCADFVRDLEGLGVAGEALSFVDESIRVPVRRSGGAATIAAGAKTMGSMPAASAKTNPSMAARPAAPVKTSASSMSAINDGTWYVRYTSGDGRVKVGKMSQIQIVAGMKGDKFNSQTQAAVNPKGPFLPLTQIPIFDDEARKMVTRQQAQAKDNNLAAEYEKLAKQYERRKWWHLLRRMIDGTLGFVGLLIWLGIFVALGAGIYFVYPMVMDYLASNTGLK